MDTLLAKQPDDPAAEVTNGVYTLIIYPLAAEYTVSADDRMVKVIRYYDARQKLDE